MLKITFSATLLLVAGFCSTDAPVRIPSAHETSDTMETAVLNLEVTSTAFKHMDFIPAQYTCDGADINPALNIKNIPEGTKSLALIVDDPDAPHHGGWVHWVVWNMPPQGVIAGNSVPGVQGTNDFGRRDWGGPCPPSGIHRYFFKVYALDQDLILPASTRREDLEKAMQGHILAKGELVGRYQRQ